LAGTARADYAIVVGSNAGGPGQTELKYAEDDARKMGALLVELGGYTADQVDVVVHPSPADLRDRLAKLGERVAADAAAGKQTRVFFYYSGHARASAIDLGSDELPLTELRQRLFALGATLTVVVLDACQSGAFSHVKGAAPAADFSFSSRQHLDASGVAVLASSSGSELSQESIELRGSYFTHHLLVGLRGAGDANGDGQVSLDEAYRYAYHQTLLATAETAVGGQHVTFEADLKGHGEVPLSFPRAATQAIVLPAPLEGQTLVEDKRAKAVVAETYKAKGAPVRIAVAPGEYEVLVRHGTTLSHCAVDSGGTVDIDHCRNESIRAEKTKGGEPGSAFLTWHPRTRFELAGFLGPELHDAYTDNLKSFGYNEKFGQPTAGLSATVLRRFAWSPVWLGGVASIAQLPEWSHSIAGSSAMQKLDWSLTTIEVAAREQLSFANEGFFSRFDAFAQLAVGLGVGHTSLESADGSVHGDSHVGPAAAVMAGLHVGQLGPPPGWGASLGLQYDWAPVVKDLIGNTHDAGGVRLVLALTYTR
jgi:hypothetical protein